MFNKKEIIHIVKLHNTRAIIENGEIFIPKTALLNWLRSCALHVSTTEVPRNTVKAIISAIESWEEEERKEGEI